MVQVALPLKGGILCVQVRERIQGFFWVFIPLLRGVSKAVGGP